MSSGRIFSLMILLCACGTLNQCYAQTETGERGVLDVDAGSKAATPEQPGPRYALVIGINDYRYLTKLGTAVNDANEVAKVLHERYGFETTLLTNANRHDIVSALDNYRRTLPEDASLLIFYAGHGYYDREADRAYWAPVEAEKDTYADWIIADEVTGTVRAMAARHVLIVSDSCYSGMIGATREDSPEMAPTTRSLYLDKMLRKKSRGVISSGGNEPVADAGAAGHSVFTYAFLQGLREIDSEEFTADELFHKFVKVQVAGKAEQVPEESVIRNSNDDFGDFVFLRSLASMKPDLEGRTEATAAPQALLGRAKALWASAAQVEAYPLFKQLAAAGNAEAQGYLGLYYDSHQPAYADVSKSDAVAATWYQKAAAGGDPRGMTNLGVMYEKGRGVEKSDVEAVTWYQKGAAAGDSEGMAHLAAMYAQGKGIGKDDAQAMIWVRKAVEAGNALGMNVLGAMYANGKVLAKDDAQAVSWYRKAAEAGNPFGMNNLGFMYANGRGVEKDDAQAVNWYRKAVAAGDSRGTARLGWMYANGRGVEKDDAQAVSWYRKAVDAGDPTGMRLLGFMYENGRGVEKDDAQAVSWYRKAADGGDREGMRVLGFRYENGRGVEKDDAQAVNWSRKAADAGDPPGMRLLGWMYANGRGVERDDAQAVTWYRKAAEAGDRDGMRLLGFMYENGRGVEKDDAQAVTWYRKAAEAGDRDGMRLLGFMYENGRGVSKDRVEAIAWYRKAAAAGDDKALSRLRELGER